MTAPREETVRRVEVAIRRLRKTAGGIHGQAEMVARALEAAAKCENEAHWQYGREWHSVTVCRACNSTGIDPARLDAGLKRLEEG